MKAKILFLLVCSFLFGNSQIAFSPVGAEWTYNFKQTMGGFPGGPTDLEKITYDRDSIINGASCKVLKHTRFYKECDYFSVKLTCIKQNADTVFMRNALTNNTWQILYNYACLQGQSWTTTIKNNSSNALYTYTVTVDSVRQVTVNSFVLKKLYVHYKKGTTSNQAASITELFGCSEFMFNYYNSTQGACDAEWFQRFLCYKDNEFSPVQFTSYPCEYTNPIGLKELANSEGPAIRQIDGKTIEIKNFEPKATNKLEVFDLAGRLLNVTTPEKQIDLSGLGIGIYVLKLSSADYSAQFKFLRFD